MPRALTGGETIVCDQGYAGREFANAVADLAPLSSDRPDRPSRNRTSPRPDPTANRVGRLDLQRPLTLERHGARTPRNLFARIAIRLLALVACIDLNHQLRRPSRATADYTA